MSNPEPAVVRYAWMRSHLLLSFVSVKAGARLTLLSLVKVLIVPFLAAFTGERLTPITWASAFTAIVGVYFLENGGSPPGIGDIWSILSAVAFAVQVPPLAFA